MPSFPGRVGNEQLGDELAHTRSDVTGNVLTGNATTSSTKDLQGSCHTHKLNTLDEGCASYPAWVPYTWCDVQGLPDLGQENQHLYFNNDYLERSLLRWFRGWILLSHPWR